MNNEQFRRLVLENPSAARRSDSPRDSSSPPNAARSSGGALGSRMKSSIPMTPRSVTGVDFARQLAEYRRESQPPAKRFRASAAPKGTKLPAGYQDRAAQLRAADEEDDATGDGEDLEKRLKALEEMVKLGQIDQETFDKLRRDLGVGGDLQSTHLVKGLDWDLLRRVKTGEDVSKAKGEPALGEEAPEEDVDEAFDRVLEEKGQEVLPAAPKMKEKKRGTMAPPPPQKKSRDEILRELKASRAAAVAAAAAEVPAEPALGARFKRIGDNKAEKKRWVELDEATGRRKEILQITDAEGKTKRKVRWLDKPGQSQGAAPSSASPATTPAGLLVPDKDAKPLGMEVPAELAAKSAAPAEEEEGDDDIFAGVGADYDPLGDVGDDSDSSESSEDGQVGERPPKAPKTKGTAETETKAPPREPAKPRNYFASSARDEEPEADDRSNPRTKDPTLLAALKRAATLRHGSPSAEAGADETDDADAETLARRRKFLEEARRRDALDAMDMDMGFGSSRIEDEEDEEAVLYDERGGKKRKRGPKKRKGDKESASDVMRVLEGRKKD